MGRVGYSKLSLKDEGVMIAFSGLFTANIAISNASLWVPPAQRGQCP